MELQRQKRMEFNLETGSFQGGASGLLADCSQAVTELGTIRVLLKGYMSPFPSKNQQGHSHCLIRQPMYLRGT